MSTFVLAAPVQHYVIVSPVPLFNMSADQLTVLVFAVLLIASHVLSRLAVAEIRDRRRYRHSLAEARRANGR